MKPFCAWQGGVTCHHSDLLVSRAAYTLPLAGNVFKLCDTTMVHVKLPSIYLGTFLALLRRATTYKHQNKFLEAVDDLRKVLQAEPDNDLAKVRMDNGF